MVRRFYATVKLGIDDVGRRPASPTDRKGSALGCMFSELNDPARQPSVYASLRSLTKSQARLEARMESLLLFRRALSSPTMCRFIPALSVPEKARLFRRYWAGPFDSWQTWLV